MESLLQDIRYGYRMLAKNPGFTLIAVLTLALGIGVNTAIFTVVNHVVLRPLPFAQPDRLMVVWGVIPDFGHEPASLPDYVDWRDQNSVFENLAAYYTSNVNLVGIGAW
jgi:putative ABC transport system permease protein